MTKLPVTYLTRPSEGRWDPEGCALLQPQAADPGAGGDHPSRLPVPPDLTRTLSQPIPRPKSGGPTQLLRQSLPSSTHPNELMSSLDSNDLIETASFLQLQCHRTRQVTRPLSVLWALSQKTNTAVMPTSKIKMSTGPSPEAVVFTHGFLLFTG